MIAIIRKRIFPEDWKSLVFKPYYNGVILSLCWVVPAYFLHFLIGKFISDEIIAFTVLCSITGLAALIAFVKKPKLLGADVVYVQKDFLQMFQKKKKKKNLEPAAIAE